MSSPTRRAVLISVEEYKNYSQTKFCHADSALLHDTLTKYCDYDAANTALIQLEKDSSFSPTDIISKVEKVSGLASPGDTVLFFFAGHGHYHQDNSYLLLPSTNPSDISGTSVNLRDISDRLRIRGGMCVRIFDACHSGLFVRDADSGVDAQGFMRSILDTHSREDWVTLAACSEHEYSHGDPDLKQGVFTHFLCDAIQNADYGSHVLPEFLKLKVCETVPAWAALRGKTQTPTINASLSGNQEIAIRIERKEERTTLPQRNEVDSSPVNPSLEARAEVISKMHHINIEDDSSTLTECITSVREYIERSFSNHSMGSNVDVNFDGVSGSNSIPRYITKIVVPTLRSAKLKSQHDLSTSRAITEEIPVHIVSRISTAFGKPIKPTPIYHHSIHQGMFPNSYTCCRLDGTGLFPDAVYYAYLSPLHLAVCLVLGGVIKTKDGRDEWQETHIEKIFAKLDEFGEVDIKTKVSEDVRQFVESYWKEAEAMISYLEWESTLAAKRS